MKPVLFSLVISLVSVSSAIADAQENHSIQADRELKSTVHGAAEQSMPVKAVQENPPVQPPPADPVKGNIDTVGGASFWLSIQEQEDMDGTKMPVTKKQVDQTILMIENRLKRMGTVNPLITRKGTKGVIVQMPGVGPEETQRVRFMLERVGILELREVSPRSDEADQSGKSLALRVQDGEEILPRYRAFTLTSKDEDGNEIARPILLNKRSSLRTGDIADAVPSGHQPNAVDITLTDKGTDKMIVLTKNMRPGIDRIAIMLDGKVISAPVVNQVPLGKNFIIDGLSEPGETQSLANALMNPFENPLIIDEIRTVAPKPN